MTELEARAAYAQAMVALNDFERSLDRRFKLSRQQKKELAALMEKLDAARSAGDQF